MTLPPAFLERPIAHRGLHDRAAGRVENSLASIKAAVDAGYGIEIDIQASRDLVPMVFHDYDLSRLTAFKGAIAQHKAEELCKIGLTDDAGTIPTLKEVMELVAGAVPLLIEVKDQDGSLGPQIGGLKRAIAKLLKGYEGDVAVMSFNPHHIAEMAGLLPDVPRGLVTDPFNARDWPTIPEGTRRRLASIPDYDAVDACFVSHNVNDLASPRIAELKAQGAQVLCWTVRSAEVEAAARKVADNITFEGYAA
ncbi:glycerophosphodiester phosphodiesterase family protein [Yoonia sp. R2331]|uniref:glycerophosphodiester phosphodiesterase family protein n=1 Tax=Yoonia sp. R2331 TaxID=3237238 RepID=UPI0034E5D9C7